MGSPEVHTNGIEVPKSRAFLRTEGLNELWEKLGKPPTIEEAILKIEDAILKPMQYDMLNYYAALARDRKGENTLLARIDENLLGISPKQRDILTEKMKNILTTLSEDDTLKQIMQAYIDREDKTPEVVKEFLKNPSIGEILSLYEYDFTSIYRDKSIAEIRENGVGNCIIFAEMVKNLLEIAHYVGVPLGVKKITYNPDQEFDHIKLLIHLKDARVIDYDPTAVFFEK